MAGGTGRLQAETGPAAPSTGAEYMALAPSTCVPTPAPTRAQHILCAPASEPRSCWAPGTLTAAGTTVVFVAAVVVTAAALVAEGSYLQFYRTVPLPKLFLVARS